MLESDYTGLRARTAVAEILYLSYSAQGVTDKYRIRRHDFVESEVHLKRPQRRIDARYADQQRKSEGANHEHAAIFGFCRCLRVKMQGLLVVSQCRKQKIVRVSHGPAHQMLHPIANGPLVVVSAGHQ